MSHTNSYESPFCTRYASPEMQYLFSADKKFTTWRRLWVALARAEHQLGLPVTQAQVDQLEANVENIDYMIASHYDEDHIGGLVPCIDNFSVSNIFGPDYVHTSNLFNNFMNTATANAIIVQYPSVGETFDFGTGSFTVLAPNGISQNSNDNSLVIKLENGSNSFIFTGDAEETSEQDMISTGMNLDCDVLSVGHHGSASSTTWDFLEATSPSYAVISCGINNQYNHPSADTMGRLSDMGIPVFRTDKQGTIIAVSDGTNISWSQEPCNDYSSGDSSVNASAGVSACSATYLSIACIVFAFLSSCSLNDSIYFLDAS